MAIGPFKRQHVQSGECLKALGPLGMNICFRRDSVISLLIQWNNTVYSFQKQELEGLFVL